ncbi:MAG: hypothetical protein CMP49_01880 [Flavobacteriales bacterium]|nr:hypothetical protein [Flavobacteriales bacterium]|tara:strand:- start:3113 stop:3829 length:717 start_codon:yes stop_codon:yes gene_type:complete
MHQTIIEKSNKIVLEEESHSYHLLDSDIEFKSVTEFINMFFNPFNEQKISKKLSGTGKYINMSPQDIIKDWELRRLRGTLVHKEIEDFINNKFKITDRQKLDLKSQQGINFLNKKCINKHNYLFSEVRIYSEQLKLAGTIDLMLYSKQRNRIYLIDWKTNVEIKKKGYKKGTHAATSIIEDCSFNKYNLQLTLYQYILEKYYNSKVDGTYIVHLTNLDYNIIKCEYQKETIEKMLESV